MYTELIQKMHTDARILQAVKESRKGSYKSFFIYCFLVLGFTTVICLWSKFEVWGFIASYLLAFALIAVSFVFFRRHKSKAKVFWGKIVRMEEDRKIVPRKGTILFARTHLYLNEERELIIAITAENGETQVIFCPPQYEKVLQIGDTVLCHSALPYPAHMSNPTKCICMHCGTMQASKNTSCIHCGATVYSVYSLHGKE